jgi:hypothetical protein
MAITNMPEHLSTNKCVVQKVGDEIYVCNTVAQEIYNIQTETDDSYVL